VVVKITTDTRQVKRFFSELSKELNKEAKKIAKEAAKKTKEAAINAIRSQDPGSIGTSWPELSPSYTSSEPKSSHHPNDKLRLYSRMMRRFKITKIKGSFKKGAVTVTVVNTSPYFKYHESDLPRSKIPARRMLRPLSEHKPHLDKLEDLAVKKVDEAINRAMR